MFTICTACKRQFRINAAQLSAAAGQVRCGYCQEVFNALTYLSDEPVSRQSSPEENPAVTDEIPTEQEHDKENYEQPEEYSEEPNQQANDVIEIEEDEQVLDYERDLMDLNQALEQPEFDISDQEPLSQHQEADINPEADDPQSDVIESDTVESEADDISHEQTVEEEVLDALSNVQGQEEQDEANKEEDNPVLAMPSDNREQDLFTSGLDELPSISTQSISEPEISETLQEPEYQESEIQETEKLDVTQPNQFDTEHSEDSEDEITAELMQEHEPEKSGRVSFYLWSLGVFLLIFFLAVQLAWNFRVQLYQHYPELKSWLQQGCDKIQIECPLYPDQGQINVDVISRDVREHPRFSNSLLVNAVLQNQSSQIIDYPFIQLSLFDNNGKMVSYRQFQPNEYLGDHIDITAGMAPDSPLHIVLELSGSLEAAESFVFDFY